jgi:hypothetical protein
MRLVLGIKPNNKALLQNRKKTSRFPSSSKTVVILSNNGYQLKTSYCGSVPFFLEKWNESKSRIQFMSYHGN